MKIVVVCVIEYVSSPKLGIVRFCIRPSVFPWAKRFYI